MKKISSSQLFPLLCGCFLSSYLLNYVNNWQCSSEGEKLYTHILCCRCGNVIWKTPINSNEELKKVSLRKGQNEDV